MSYDEVGSSVEHRVAIVKGQFKVECVDTYDGERAEVYDVKWDGERLRYCLHWESTGRFSKNSMLHLTDGQVELTSTHTDAELLRRKLPMTGRKKPRKP